MLRSLSCGTQEGRTANVASVTAVWFRLSWERQDGADWRYSTIPASVTLVESRDRKHRLFNPCRHRKKENNKSMRDKITKRLTKSSFCWDLVFLKVIVIITPIILSRHSQKLVHKMVCREPDLLYAADRNQSVCYRRPGWGTGVWPGWTGLTAQSLEKTRRGD